MTSLDPAPMTTAEAKAALADTFAHIRRTRMEKDTDAEKGRAVLAELAALCARHGTTDQTVRLRRFLHSAYSEFTVVTLNDVMTLDWDLRCGLLAVLRGLGGEALPDHAIRDEFERAGLLDWFMEAREGKWSPENAER